MRSLKLCLVNALRQGDNAYVYRISGVTRAPMAAAAMGAVLMGISFGEAEGIINQTRKLDSASEEQLQGACTERVLHEGVANAEVPTGFSCCVANQDDIVVHATTSVDRGTEPICRWKKGATGKRNFKGNVMTVETVEQASSQFGGRFCFNCQALLRASLRLQVERFYS